MLNIYKLRSDSVFDFAAEELKKYLRMMMPEEKVINISYNPEAKDGFRLGLLEDFGLPCEAKDVSVDDVIHIDTEVNGGILAGSNKRSVLFAVYRYLKLNGCRFLFPGAEGEYIPHKAVQPQKYHKLADHRLRGHSIEGSPSVEQVLAYIDWHAKEELNTFGSYGIYGYMNRYYSHQHNESNRAPEFLDHELAEQQWRALFECEATKRGQSLKCGGHDLIPKALGIPTSDRKAIKEGKKEVPADAIPYIAQMNGVRKLHKNDICFTNLCMSNPVVQDRMVEQVIQRLIDNPLVDSTGLSLGDTSHNHCECENCRKKRPSDWLVIILNKVDAELTRRGWNNKVGFSFYVDTMFAPVEEKFNNPDRFNLTFCPITRNYVTTMESFDNLPEPIPYERNAWQVPKTSEEVLALLKDWRRVYPGDISVFEYHFWRHQYRDPGLASMSRRLYEDVRAYRNTGFTGCMQDGSDKSFFPHGFHGHIFNETLMNRDLDYEAELADFFSHLYGEDWKIVRKYLDDITAAFDHKYMSGLSGAGPDTGAMYNPAHVADLKNVKELTAAMRAVIKEHKQLPTRPQSVAWRLLLLHTEYCDSLADVMIEKALGHDKYAMEIMYKFFEEFGKHDYELDRWFDINLCFNAIYIMVKQKPKIEL